MASAAAVGGGNGSTSATTTTAAAPILLSPFLKGVAGSMGGLVEAVCLQPIDTIKTRLQLDHTGQYRNLVHCGRTIAATEGTASLWKGLTPFATQLFAKYALRFGTQQFYAGLLRDKDGKLSDGRRMLSGLCAGVTEALVIIAPLETTKIRLQQQRGLDKAALKYHGPVHAASTILREEGVRGLWSGAVPTMMRNGTNQMCLFFFKNKADALYWDKHEGDGKKLTPTKDMPLLQRDALHPAPLGMAGLACAVASELKDAVRAPDDGCEPEPRQTIERARGELKPSRRTPQKPATAPASAK